MNNTLLAGMFACNHAMAMTLVATSGAGWERKLAALAAMMVVAFAVDARWALAKLPAAWHRDAAGMRHAALAMKHGQAAAAGVCIAFV